MYYKIINSNSVIKKIIEKDSLFHGNYCVDPYQNCEFGCHYCDSSLEKTIYIKANVVETLKKELKQVNKGRIIIGSVHDPYQPAEKEYKFARAILETLKQNYFPCHILTKSPLILRDIDILSQIDCMVTISITSLENKVIRIFEPDAPLPNDRLQTIRILRSKGIISGLALMPMLPYIIESELKSIVKAAHDVDAQYLLHKYLELKGDQEKFFMNLIESHYPHLLTKYNELYNNDFNPRKEYIQGVNDVLLASCKNFKISDKITT